MNRVLRYAFYLILTVELAVVLSIFWEYSESWGNDKVLVAVVLTPLIFVIYGLCRNSVSAITRTSAHSGWRPTRLMIGGASFGLLGMLFGWTTGPHLAGSVVIYVGLMQTGLLWFALWRLGKGGIP
jgi:hypothetical protein